MKKRNRRCVPIEERFWSRVDKSWAKLTEQQVKDIRAHRALCRITLKELAALPLRGPDVERYCGDVLAGAQVFPLSLLGAEGEPLLVSGRAPSGR